MRLMWILCLLAATICCSRAGGKSGGGLSIIPENLGKACTSVVQCGTDGLICIDGACSFCDREHSANGTSCRRTRSTQYRCRLVWDTANETNDCANPFQNEGCLCIHKELKEDFGARDVLTVLVILVGGSIAAGGGLGGGGVFVPVFILISEFIPQYAIPLSNVCITGGALANWVQLGRKRHPEANRPLIDYSLALMMQPLSLAGTIVGVIFNTMFPDWLTLGMLVVLLGTTIVRTAQKGVAQWRVEAMQDAAVSATKSPIEMKSSPAAAIRVSTDKKSQVKLQETPLDEVDDTSTGAAAVQTLAEIKASEAQMFPLFKVGLMFLILASVTIHSLVVGGGKGPSLAGIETCTPIFWSLFLLIFPVLILFQVFHSRFLINRHQVKLAAGFVFVQGDVKWTKDSIIKVSLASFLAGILASLLGLGGGMVLSPLMLELGVPPEVAAATSSFMIVRLGVSWFLLPLLTRTLHGQLFTGISGIVQYALRGRILYDYGLMSGAIGIVASFIGQSLILYLVRRYRKKSLVIFSMVLLIGVASVLLLVSGIISVQHEIRSGSYMGISGFCPTKA